MVAVTQTDEGSERVSPLVEQFQLRWSPHSSLGVYPSPDAPSFPRPNTPPSPPGGDTPGPVGPHGSSDGGVEDLRVVPAALREYAHAGQHQRQVVERGRSETEAQSLGADAFGRVGASASASYDRRLAGSGAELSEALRTLDAFLRYLDDAAIAFTRGDDHAAEQFEYLLGRVRSMVECR